MRDVNVIMVFDPAMGRILMCRRRKDPYKGMLNLVGGKIEPGEDGLAAAYRELLEETGIGREIIMLRHLMDFTYSYAGEGQSYRLEAYTGLLQGDVVPAGDENELLWVDAGEDFFDTARFAGHGNIGHMLWVARLHADVLFGTQRPVNQ